MTDLDYTPLKKYKDVEIRLGSTELKRWSSRLPQ